jgi:hypothetical protein
MPRIAKHKPGGALAEQGGVGVGRKREIEGFAESQGWTATIVEGGSKPDIACCGSDRTTKSRRRFRGRA